MGQVKRKGQKRSVSREAAATAQVVPVESGNPGFSSRRSPSTEFNPDYSYVIKDLKFIGILAVTFTSLLIVLSFFLR